MLLLYFIKILQLFHAYTQREFTYKDFITLSTEIALPQ